MKIEYIKQGDYLIPTLLIKPSEKRYNIGKFGKLRLIYLKEYKRVLYKEMLIKNLLQDHLIAIDKQANNYYELLLKQFIEKENINEELKANDQMKWVRINE